jgi:hypothetical protein
MRFFVVGWFSATAEGHDSQKGPCGNQILLILFFVLGKPGLPVYENEDEWWFLNLKSEPPDRSASCLNSQRIRNVIAAAD